MRWRQRNLTSDAVEHQYIAGFTLGDILITGGFKENSCGCGVPFEFKWERGSSEEGKQKLNHVAHEGHLSASLERKKKMGEPLRRRNEHPWIADGTGGGEE